MEVIKYEFWWGVSSISGGVGGINFEFLVVLSFDQFRILLRILLRNFPMCFTNNFTKHFTKDFNKGPVAGFGSVTREAHDERAHNRPM